ncbi:1526_t:CDS:1, partial [Racocetra persica]
MAKVCEFLEIMNFSKENYYNISIFENKRSNQQVLNIKEIYKQNKQRAAKYITNCE